MRTIITSTAKEGAREVGTFETQQSRMDQLKPCLLAVFVAGVLILLGASPALAQNFALASYDSNGNLDTGFGGNGKVITSFGSGLDEGASAVAVAVDSAGRVVAAGTKGTWDQRRFALARYNIDGSLDTTFGKGGKAFTSFPNAGIATANAVAIDQQGRIVVAGYTEENNFSSWSRRFALARYNPDGSLDLSFSNDGKVQTDFPDPSPSFDHCVAKAVAIDYSGRIIAAGYIRGFSDTAFAIARYNSDGSLDPTFNNDGRVITDVIPNNLLTEEINAIKIDSWGNIVGAGRLSIGNFSSFAVLRYNPSGDLDVSFNGTGIAYPTFINIFKEDAASGLAIDSQGRIVVAGTAWAGETNHFALARLNYDGTLDNSFNGGGKVITYFPRCPSAASAVMIDGDGKILAAGSVSGSCSGGFALARYNADGSLDSTFTGGDYNGMVTTDFSCPGTQTTEGANAIALQYLHGIPRIILAGFTNGDPCPVKPTI